MLKYTSIRPIHNYNNCSNAFFRRKGCPFFFLRFQKINTMYINETTQCSHTYTYMYTHTHTEEGRGCPVPNTIPRLQFLDLVITSSDTRRCVRSVLDWSYPDTSTGKFPGSSPSLPLCETYPWTESTYNCSRGHRFRPPPLFSHRRTPQPSSCSLCEGSKS